MTTMWMVRSGRGSDRIDEFLEHGVVAIGWEQVGKLSPKMHKDELLKAFVKTYPKDREGKRNGAASQVYRFLTEIQIGDHIVTYDRERRRYVLGKVVSNYEWKPGLIDQLPNVRRVEWTQEVNRDALGTSTRNTLGAIQTLFKLSAEASNDLLQHAAVRGEQSESPPEPTPPIEQEEEEEARATLVNETIEKADEFIEDAINALDWSQMQQLVAGVLRAMGYRTTVADAGPDRGVDIFASPDGLGLQEPRIFVEVKHRSAQMGAKEIRAFLGGRKKGDKCLYISTGGFSKDAHYEADRADIATTLVTLPMLRKLVVDYYESLDSEAQALVPLRRLYWPEVRK